ncbi:hypothetical protein PPL_10568 [Heterostelium album PN500]|uniref:BED-type domain-containing protein n=1 Tax=Heterostelium pallidum (strain ATCC 26659 / Pp 5 / PN500) TaxID=670386 RepID=D3BRF8_HETP5|nr:hypothetical protein PPL_10568 [Heterostelium album PN500]EFA75990.1 hypothetical protein PPL_10568 [Heterostelium album PN500]|eukprot:XP_020428124.1 hypothetical protein PPL_10568 [Heterostelium album PN500]
MSDKQKLREIDKKLVTKDWGAKFTTDYNGKPDSQSVCVICKETISCTHKGNIRRHLQSDGCEKAGERGTGDTDYDKDKVDDALVDVIVNCNLPISLADNIWFDRFLSFFHYTSPSAKVLKQKIMDRSQSMEKQIKSFINTVDHVSVTMDSWTNTAQDNFTSFNAHTLDKDFNFISLLLSPNVQHTKSNVENTAISVLGANGWNIKNKIVSITTNNADNICTSMKSYLKDSTIQHTSLKLNIHLNPIPSRRRARSTGTSNVKNTTLKTNTGANKRKLEMTEHDNVESTFTSSTNTMAEFTYAVSDEPSINNVLRKVRTICSKIKYSPTHANKLRDMVRADAPLTAQETKSKKYKVLIGCPTRWTSVYQMVVRYIELKVYIDQILLDQSEFHMSDKEIDMLDDYSVLLYKFESSTMELATRNTCSIERLSGIIINMKDYFHCEDVKNRKFTTEGRRLKEVLEVSFNKRMDQYINNDEVKVASFFNPCHKDSFNKLDNDVQQKVIKRIEQEISEISSQHTPSPMKKQKNGPVTYRRLSSTIANTDRKINEITKFLQEVKEKSADNTPGITTNLWWKENQN